MVKLVIKEGSMFNIGFELLYLLFTHVFEGDICTALAPFVEGFKS